MCFIIFFAYKNKRQLVYLFSRSDDKLHVRLIENVLHSQISKCIVNRNRYNTIVSMNTISSILVIVACELGQIPLKPVDGV
jgi:hypothetical protein